jgi:peptidoglycan hydrolase-like protein with peptidoglycan-binding domain
VKTAVEKIKIIAEKMIEILKLILLFIKGFTSKNRFEFVEQEVAAAAPVEKGEQKPKYKLLKPITHKRYLTCYYIPKPLTEGNSELLDAKGVLIAKVSTYSKKRLDMEGTGVLWDGRLINVGSRISGQRRYIILDKEKAPHGVGIYNKPLVPWESLAAHMGQIKNHFLFERTVYIPHLDKKIKKRWFRIHDTGGAMRECPYEKGLWRSGNTNSSCGQFDVFIGDWKDYNTVKQWWKDYADVYVLPRNYKSPKGIQESLNGLLDSKLDVDGICGPKTLLAIKVFQEKTGAPMTGVWGDLDAALARSSFENLMDLEHKDLVAER